MEMAPATGKSYLVIGCGSVGLSIIETLLERGDTNIKGFDMGLPKRPLPISVPLIKGSVTDLEALRQACEGVDVVFTTVGIIRYYERLSWQYAVSHAINVTGTANIVKACVEANVQVLVQTSSSNVCIAKELVNMNMDETSPWVDPANTPNHYCWTKVQAEKIIIDANGTPLPNGGRLVTGACRPCSGIFGPNDGFILEESMTQGYVIMLTPSSKIDYTFVENVVWGHILLEKALWAEPRRIGGEVFGVSNLEPIVQDDMFVSLARFYNEATGKRFKRFYMPLGLFIVLAYIFETFQRVSRRRIQGILCNLTPATLDCASLSYGFSSKKAKEMLGYEPLYTVDEGIQKTVDMWQLQNAARRQRAATI